MKKLNLILIVITIMFSTKVFAQDMMPPPAPLDIPVFNSMSGTWVSNQYEMMGSKMTDECTQKMVLNSQFFRVDVKGVTDNNFTYETTVFIAPSKDGTLSGWGFDIYGKNGITNYTGTWADNAVYLTGKSAWGTELRNIKMQGDIMIQNVDISMKDANGKEIPHQATEIIFNKK